MFKTMIPLTAVSVGKVRPSQIDLVTDQVSNTKKEAATDDTAI